jgi:hypothetical protein
MDRLDPVRRHRFRPIEVEIVRQTVIGSWMGGIALMLWGLVYAAGTNDETEPSPVLSKPVQPAIRAKSQI